MVKTSVFALVLSLCFFQSLAKVYDRCELARELKNVHKIPDDQLATWVCIAKYESEFNTKAENHQSGDHGIFQISQIYWCSPPGTGCGIPCSKLHDDKIGDDVQCVRKIYAEHQRLTGNGFTAWTVYNQHCNDKQNVKQYIQGCF